MLAARLEKASMPYRVLPKNSSSESIFCIDGNKRQHFHPTTIAKEELSASHIVFMPLKAYQIESCVKELQACIAHSPVVLMHNGMGTAHTVQQLLPDAPLLACITSNGVMRSSSQEITLTGSGPTQAGWLANYDVEVEKWMIQTFLPLFPPGLWQNDIQCSQWRKLAVNAVINPLTAIHQVPNGALLEPIYRDSMEQLCRETAEIMTACGYAIGVEPLLKDVLQVAQATAKNFSSMNRDCYYGRQTELAYITGYILRQAQQREISLPCHQALYDQLEQFSFV